MNNIIPLHSIVLIIQNDHRSGISEANRLFPAHEIIHPEKTLTELVGQSNRSDLNNIALSEMRHKTALKLSLGERVVLLASVFNRQEHRQAFAHIAQAQGASVLYMVGKNITDANILTGDDVAQVIKDNNVYVSRPIPNNPLQILKDRFRGITVIGDVHGDLKNLRDAVAWAKSRRHFIWFLGDIIDYGHQSIATMTLVYHLVMRSEASLILGNHERKIARWVNQQEIKDGRIIRLSEGNRVTTDALLKLNVDSRTQWYGQFRSLINRSNLISSLGKTTFTHAAIHPDFWFNRHEHQGIEDYALYGEPDTTTADFRLSYQWVDSVPNGHTVFVGHDVRSYQAPLVTTGANGGRVVFLDTGSGKGGFLSTADLRFTDNGELHLENFNRY